MKQYMIVIAVMVSVISAQGVQAQDGKNEKKRDTLEAYRFESIPVVELPMGIQEMVAIDYEKSWIAKAYKNKKKIYKIELKKINSQTQVIFVNAEGKLVKLNSES